MVSMGCGRNRHKKSSHVSMMDTFPAMPAALLFRFLLSKPLRRSLINHDELTFAGVDRQPFARRRDRHGLPTDSQKCHQFVR